MLEKQAHRKRRNCFSSAAVKSKDKSHLGIFEFSFLSTVFCFLLLSPLHAKPLHYLYINAREGNASGGHTALRFDKETFHFQHYDGGIIRLVRHASTDFDFQYRYLDNRTLHQATIELNDVYYDQLHKHFKLIFLKQKQQDDILKEIYLNISLLNHQSQHPLLSIKAAGLLANNTIPGEIEALTINHLQQQIKYKYGDTFLDELSQQLKAEINALQPRPWSKDSLQLNENAFLHVPYSFASQHIDAASKVLFLQAIKKGTPLNEQHYFIPKQSVFTLSKAEREQLTHFQSTLIHHLLNLLNSSRPDWGSAAFTLYARILSLSLAINSNTFVFLNSYSEGSFSIPTTEVENYRALFHEQKSQALSKILQLKNHLFTANQDISEKDYSRLEMLSNYYYERERGLAENRSIRISGEQLLPTKSIPLPINFLPQLTSQHSAISRQRLANYKTNVTQQMQTLYHYNLLTRNCVTEIFGAIDKANINDKYIQEIEQLAHNNLIAFIPFGSYHSLSSGYQKLSLPSYRHQQLTTMYQQENDILVYLREFNTLSASHYKYNDQDSAFLFFTDEEVWNRPLLGAFNLLTGITVSLYGGFSLPFDSGKMLKNGVMGMLMSLPELAFFNIRKGSYKHLLPPMQTE